MEQRRLILFFVASMAILVIWTNFLAPILMPLPERPPLEQGVQQEQQAPAENLKDQKTQEKITEEKHQAEELTDTASDNSSDQEYSPDKETPPNDAEQETEEPPQKEAGPRLVADWPEKIEHQNIILGSVDPESGYFIQVELTSQGAGVLDLKLSDPRYRELEDREKPLALINSRNDLPPTMSTVFYGQKEALVEAQDVAKMSEWQVLAETIDPDHPEIVQSVTFRSVMENLGIEIFKTYSLIPSEKSGDELHDARLTNVEGYELVLDIKARNLTDKPQNFVYHLQGPVGVPLENRENTRKFRQIAVGFLQNDGSVESEILTAADLLEAVDSGKPEIWNAPMRYVGVDIQYFATLLVPTENQNENQTYESALPMLVEREENESHSDISIVLQSKEFQLQPKGEVLADGSAGDVIEHQVKLFAGPKREVLLSDMQAGAILDYGTMGVFASFMLKILNRLHLIGLPYGIAIVILTVIVRSCLYPLSRKQALGAKKMKELQPKLKEIKKKYAKDKEKQARAQMELFRKHNYNPLAGCLPLLLQFPIFISLYTAISSSVDLRLAPFLWIDNLAAPDALFRLPFALPFLGQNFNLLPILTIFLFIAQQRLFMPPPETEEQAMQYKMMNFMMVFMGFLFYRVPAGLCLYFITSSLWGMSERKLLDLTKSKDETAPQASQA